MPRKRSKEPVQEIRIEALKFLTIAEDDAVWEHEGPFDGADTYAFVRIRPPAEATDAHVARVKSFFPKARVRVLSRSKPQVVPEQKKVKATTLGIRETVIMMVQEANTADREALSRLAERVLSEVGL
jgi:hypothetical protein